MPVQKPTVKKASPTPAVHRSGSGANLSRADPAHALIAEVQAPNGVVNCHGIVEGEVVRQPQAIRCKQPCRLEAECSACSL